MTVAFRPARFLLRVLAALAALLALAWFVRTAVVVSPALADATPVETLVERGRWREAKATLEPRVRANPADPEAAWLLSRIHSAFDEHAEAQRFAEQAVAQQPNDARFHEQLAMVLGEQAENAGPLKGLGLAKKFKQSAERAVALDPRRFEAQIGLLIFYRRAPKIAGGSREKAAEKAREIERLDPLWGHDAHARLALADRDTVKAHARWRAAAEQFPNDYRSRVRWAGALIQKGEWADAERHARAALQLDPERSGAYTLLAAAHAHASRWSELDALLTTVESRLPGNRMPHYQAARLLVTEKREAARAERWLRAYLATPPEGGAPSHAGARWRLGNALEHQGRTREAIAELELALKSNPDLDGAKQDLKRLRKNA